MKYALLDTLYQVNDMVIDSKHGMLTICFIHSPLEQVDKLNLTFL